MKKFEYITKRIPYAGDLEELDYALNELGKEGWELCAMTGNIGFPICTFKKEMK